eukprot:7809347-Pyramimonas_sp.AAC.1
MTEKERDWDWLRGEALTWSRRPMPMDQRQASDGEAARYGRGGGLILPGLSLDLHQSMTEGPAHENNNFNTASTGPP